MFTGDLLNIARLAALGAPRDRREDARQEAVAAMLQARAAFDPGRGVPERKYLHAVAG